MVLVKIFLEQNYCWLVLGFDVKKYYTSYNISGHEIIAGYFFLYIYYNVSYELNYS